jgi:hypothetical protein
LVSVRCPKTWLRGARRQHAKIDEPSAVRFIARLLPGFLPCELLWPASYHVWRKRLQTLTGALMNVPCLILPSSLRPGGATWFFQETQKDIARLCWRGRWSHSKTLSHYVQEWGAHNVLQSIDAPLRARMHSLATLLPASLDEFGREETSTDRALRRLLAACRAAVPDKRPA